MVKERENRMTKGQTDRLTDRQNEKYIMTISSIVIVCSTVSLLKYQGQVDQNQSPDIFNMWMVLKHKNIALKYV
jgi:hypothetical protein